MGRLALLSSGGTVKVFKVAVAILVAICLLLIVTPTTPSRSLSSSASDITFEADIAGSSQGLENVRYFADLAYAYYFSGYGTVFAYVPIVRVEPGSDDYTAFAINYSPWFSSTPAFTFNFINADHNATSISLPGSDYVSGTVTSTLPNSLEHVWHLNSAGMSFDLHRKSSLEINSQLGGQ